jgi:hypothetical protein
VAEGERRMRVSPSNERPEEMLADDETDAQRSEARRHT